MRHFRQMNKKELLFWLQQHSLTLGKKLGELQGQGIDPDTLMNEGEILDFLIYSQDTVDRHEQQPPALNYEVRAWQERTPGTDVRGAKSHWVTMAAMTNRNDACIVAEALYRRYKDALPPAFVASQVEVWHVQNFLPHEKGPACTDRWPDEHYSWQQ